MKKVQVTAKKDFLESLASARPIAALAELIWNGFDAQSDKVEVFLDLNELNAIDSIRVKDYGYGIDLSQVDSYFGSLGESWKKAKVKQNGRALHGKNGKGRFKAFAMGDYVEWKTTYKDEGSPRSYTIVGSSRELDNFETTESIEAKDSVCGTEVVIQNVKHDFRSLKGESAQLQLGRMFAAYLTEYPEVFIEYDGNKIDPQAAQDGKYEYDLGNLTMDDGRQVDVKLVVIEWNIPTDRTIHLCDSKGVALHEVPAGQGIRAPGFNFTAYVKSDEFRELDKDNQLALSDLNANVQKVLAIAKNKIRGHFRRRISESNSKIVDRWKEEHIYPYEDSPNLDPVEIAERQVFDILAVNVQSYLPSFDDADNKSKKFTFLLLAQAIRENPDSVQTIIGEVLGLKKEAQDDLAELLGKTPLSSIISSAKLVANRLDFLMGLDALIFEKESKEKLLERDQLHKILENETWLFHEEFSFSGSEQRLEDVLRKHLEKLGEREDETIDPVYMADGKKGRVDLMLHKAVQPRKGEYDYLVVELKRPSKKIDAEVLTQIEKYAIAVASDERFRNVTSKWRFVAIANDLDAYATRKANQRDKPKGQVFDDAELNITVWVHSWAEIINNARVRLNFFNQQLSYEADRDSSKAYLQKAHSKFLPDIPMFDDDGLI